MTKYKKMQVQLKHNRTEVHCWSKLNKRCSVGCKDNPLYPFTSRLHRKRAVAKFQPIADKLGIELEIVDQRGCKK